MKHLALFYLILIPALCFSQMSAVTTVAKKRNGEIPITHIRSLDAEFFKYQREDVPFTIHNTSVGNALFTWTILNLETKSVVEVSHRRSPSFTLNAGYFVLHGESQGLNPDEVPRLFYHKQITVLPPIFTEGEADRVLSLDDGNNIFDASTWTDGERIFLKKIDAAVGRIRIDNYESSTRAHLLVDPSSEMEINEFDGSHAIYLVNCQNLLIDAVGTTDTYGLFLDGTGDNTSHAINLNLVSDIRCAGIEIYGVKIEVPQSGASAFRMLGDESATYNRTLPPLENFKLGHFWVVEAGHEGLYSGFTDDTDGGFGGPRQFRYLWAWDWLVEDTGRDAIQPCNQIDFIIHDWIITGCATLGEGSHNSYISSNAGNQNGKIFNIRASGGIHGISHDFGFTGANPWYWNIVMEVSSAGSNYNFIQVGNAPNTDFTIINTTVIVTSGDLIIWRFDSSSGQGTQDVDDFNLTNCTVIKGGTANFFTKDGTNPETNWDITSGNLQYTPGTAATALLDATTHLPSSVASPSVAGGILWSSRRTYDDFLGDYGSMEFMYDIDGWIESDGDNWSGVGSGIPLKIEAL
jgi:hypothetical protein